MIIRADRRQFKMRRWFGRMALALWVPLAVVPGVYLLAGHLTSLPAPQAGDTVLTSNLDALFPATTHALRAVHVLYERCGCSSRVAETLLARGARADLREVVIIVDDDEKTIDPARVAALRAHGFPVALLSTKAAAERLHVMAVPLLMVVGADDRIRYAGGYTARRESRVIEDARVIAEVTAGRVPDPLPIFGCAVASSLQKALDPLGLKY
jgi:hypothetical protein